MIKGYRKIVLGFSLIGIGVAIDLIAKGGLSANLLDLLKSIGYGFFAGNGIEHIAGALMTKSATDGQITEAAVADASTVSALATEPEPTSATAADTEMLYQELKDIQSQLAAASESLEAFKKDTLTSLMATNQGISYVVGFIQASAPNYKP